MITFLSGGTGTPKLLMGMQNVMDRKDISVIANTGEDTRISGIYLSPDTDSVTYALAGIIDEQFWYGVKRDTFITHKALASLGHKELLRFGDKDRATKIYRTIRMEQGATLSEVTEELCASLGVKEKVVPMTDDTLTTTLYTELGKTAFHDFLVRDHGRHSVERVDYCGSDKAKASDGAIECLHSSDAIVIGPSNPITSIGPILSIKGIREECKKRKTIIVSPIIGDRVFSGPAARLMGGLGYEPTALGVASYYKDVADIIVIDEMDTKYAQAITDLGMEVRLTSIAMKDLNSRIALGSFISTLW